MKCTRAVLSSVACPAVQHFSTLCHKRHDYRGKNLTEPEMCVLIFSTNFSETFFILRRIERDMIKNVYWSSCKVPSILSDFNKTRSFSTYFRKTLEYKILWKSFQCESSFYMRFDGRTDGYDKTNSRFSQFCERAYKPDIERKEVNRKNRKEGD